MKISFYLELGLSTELKLRLGTWVSKTRVEIQVLNNSAGDNDNYVLFKESHFMML